MWWINLLWICLHLFHLFDYFHFLDLLQFLYLLLYFLPYQCRILHHHIVVPLDKSLQLGHIQQAKNLIFLGENGLRTIMVLNKKSMVLIHYTNGSRGLPLEVRLHLDVRRGIIFLTWTTSSSSSLTIRSDGLLYTPTNSWSNMERREQPRAKLLNGLGLLS